MNQANGAGLDELIERVFDDYQRSLDGEVTAFTENSTLALSVQAQERIRRGKACLAAIHELAKARKAGRNLAPVRESRSLPRSIGRFEIRGELGIGGFGIVYLAYDPLTRREVAIKIPRLEAMASEGLRKRFELEAAAAGKLDHPNIVPVLEAGTAGMIPYIASNHYEGPNLAKWLLDHPEPVASRAAAELVRQLALAVAHAHSHGVLHRDLKPSNVLLARKERHGNDGSNDLESFTPKLMDFGLAKIAELAGDMTKTGAILGTVRYMSPEQSRGDQQAVTTATDVHALGVILYELLTRRTPFEGASDIETLRKIENDEPTSIRSSRRDASGDLVTICLKCIEKEPAKRYASARELADDLGRYLTGEPIRARPVAPLERLLKWARRRPAIASLSLVLILAAVSMLVMSSRNNASLSRALAESRAAERIALQRSLEARQHAYCGAMSLLARDVSTMRLNEQLSLLKAQIPKPGEPDVRGFEWWLRWRRLQLDQAHRKIGEHPGGVTAAALDPSGRLAATGGKDGVIRLWKIPEGALVGEIRCDSLINDVAFRPGGSHLAAALEDGSILLSEVGNSKASQTMKAHSAWAASVAFSPDGTLLASGGDRRVLLWNCETGQQQSELSGHTDTPRDLIFNRDGTFLISAGEDGTIRAWDVATGAPSQVVPEGTIDTFTDRWPRRLALAPSGASFVAVFNHFDSYFWRLDPRIEKPERAPRTMGNPRCVCLAPDGNGVRITYGMENGAVVFSSYPRGTPDVNQMLGHRASVEAVAVTDDCRHLISGDSQGTVLLWKLDETLASRWVFDASKAPALATIAPSGNFFIDSRELEFGIVDCMSNKLATYLPFSGADKPSLPAIAPNEDAVAICDSENRVHFRSLPNGTSIGTVPLPIAPGKIVFSPDGASAAACAEGQTYLMTVRPSAMVRVLAETSSHGAAFLDSTHILTPCKDGTLRGWNTESAQPESVIPLSDHELGGIDLSQDRKIAAVGGFSAVFIVDLATRKIIATLPHKSDVHDLVFLARGATLLTTDTGSGIRLWNTATWQEVGGLDDFEINGYSLSTSSDGNRILGSRHGTVTILDATPFEK